MGGLESHVLKGTHVKCTFPYNPYRRGGGEVGVVAYEMNWNSDTLLRYALYRSGNGYLIFSPDSAIRT